MHQFSIFNTAHMCECLTKTKVKWLKNPKCGSLDVLVKIGYEITVRKLKSKQIKFKLCICI